MANNLDDYNVEDGNGETSALHHTSAILQAATARAVQATKIQRVLKPRAPRFGFKFLRQLTNNIEFTGETVKDLDNLMKVYREWTHSMYPKFQFRDVLDKVERHCRTAPMKAYLVALERAQQENRGFDEVEYIAERNAADAMTALEGAMNTERTLSEETDDNEHITAA